MKLPSFKRLFSTDFPKEFQQLVDQLSVSLNIGIETLYDALNNNVSLADNIACTVKNVTITVDSNGIPKQTTAFTLNSTVKISGTTVINAINQDNSGTYPLSGIFISGNQKGNSFTINNITGLQPNQKYLLTVIAWNA